MSRPRVSHFFPSARHSFHTVTTKQQQTQVEPVDDHENLGSPPRGDSADTVDGLCIPCILVNETIFQGSFHVLCGGRSRSGQGLMYLYGCGTIQRRI
jgi:hypothetical protein